MKQVKFTTEVESQVASPPPPDTSTQTPPPQAQVAPVTNQPETIMVKKVKKPLSLIIVSLIVVVAGIGSGYLLSTATADNQTSPSAVDTATGEVMEIKEGETYGVKNGASFTDEAEGVLVSGGVKGEGSHHLMRPGGPSQNVYLTSSVLDLDQFEDTEVKVWGETFAAQQAGWLMDVGKVEVLKLNAEKPFEETD
jgi:hypothetical protein